MANSLTVMNYSYDIGTVAASGAGTIPMMFVPKNCGAMTLLGAHVTYGIAPTGTINAPELITLTDGATPTVSGTLGTAVSWTFTSNGGKRAAVTLSQAYIQPGTADSWIGLKYASGTVQVGDPTICLTYVMGR